jgi:dTDP-4-dehydrorhamnose reductase
MNRKILIIGGSGLLALNWALTMKTQFEIILALHERQINLTGIRTLRVDTSSTKHISEAIDQIRPGIVINTAGLTSVEVCEKFPDKAVEVNTTLAIDLARICIDRNIKFVHISTDHLFSGEKELVTENEKIYPKNVYGETKADAEYGIEIVNSDALIIRTNFYAWGTSYRHSFSDIIINFLRDGRPINLFTDVFYTPILAKTLIEVIHQLIDINASGIFNVVSDQRISKYDFGLNLARVFNLEKSLINKDLMSNNISLVQRPNDMSLSNLKVSNLLGIVIGGVDAHLSELYEQEVSGYNKKIKRL